MTAPKKPKRKPRKPREWFAVVSKINDFPWSLHRTKLEAENYHDGVYPFEVVRVREVTK
jgi:hypothetical protein